MPLNSTNRPPLDGRRIELVEPEMIEILRWKTPMQRIAVLPNARNSN